MKKKGTIPLEKPLLLYTDQGPLCAIILEMDHEVLLAGVLFQQGWVPRERQLPIAGVFLEINRQAVQGWAPLQEEGWDEVWDLAQAQHCGLCWGKTFRIPRD
jgi:hypothetical protein